ncbi:MAG: hypothetical protein PHF36_01375 [Candidatus Cloacimonetes bacterium]|jgi:hypothetical protein|nr:hypothetical protein [Candidatus Cloacimonadota bacterium]MDD3502438.1 hypothetical protein [Candidatus Cloacimonadota bacterium]
MVPIEFIDNINEKLSYINSQSTKKYTLRYQEDIIYIDIKSSQITTCYCRITCDKSNKYLIIQFYNYDLCEYEQHTMRVKKEVFKTDLELLLNLSK